MSESYSPGPGASPVSPYTTVFLSQRDLGLQVPINYVTTPGVSFTAACFPFLRYEDDNSGDCLSNLIAVGFRRFEIDLFWDQQRQVWSFCPVAIPASAVNTAPSSPATTSFSSSTISAPTSINESIANSQSGVSATQVSSSLSSISPASFTGSAVSSITATTLGEILSTISVPTDTSNDPLITIGPYVCTETINLSTFTSQLFDYIQETENTLDAHLLYVILNIHAAASDSSPLSPAAAPSSLPSPSNLLGELFAGNLSAYLYTPSNLRSDRLNLNGSWYTVAEINRPVDDYYSTSVNEYGIVSTEDGWPSESYIEFSKSKRLLLGFGSVDPQMDGYNFTGDDGIIFPNGYTQNNSQNVTPSSSDQPISGCFLIEGMEDLSRINSSWATRSNFSGFDFPTTPSANLTPYLNLTSHSTQCGISPILNVTLLDTTARDNYVPYQNFSYSTIWSWSAGEPRNYTPGDASSSSLFRCATSNMDVGGRWVVNDCSQKYFAACRLSGQPYNWTITTYSISYSYASQACPEFYAFAAPRTALENSYLTQAMINSRRDFNGHGAWVDFNSLQIEGCWTSGGPNATCPYGESVGQYDDLRKKYVLVPTLAAFIVLVVTALTVFAKGAGNRNVRKRARKRDDAHVYEGVPS